MHLAVSSVWEELSAEYSSSLEEVSAKRFRAVSLKLFSYIPRYLHLFRLLLISTMLVMLDNGVLVVFNVFSGVEEITALF